MVEAYSLDKIMSQRWIYACRYLVYHARYEVGVVGDGQLRMMVEHSLQERGA